MDDDGVEAAAMQGVFALLSEEFGKLVILPDDWSESKASCAVALPGGMMPVVAHMVGSHEVEFIKLVGELVGAPAEIYEALLREQSLWIYGRVERTNDSLAVSHTVDERYVDGDLLRTIVGAVHNGALEIEQLISTAGFELQDPMSDEDEPDGDDFSDLW